jgi:polyvinyl alcohol dehydrogenase (cytochrome)
MRTYPRTLSIFMAALALCTTWVPASAGSDEGGDHARGACHNRHQAPGGDWSTYGHDLDNSRRQDLETDLGPTRAAKLAPAWSYDVAPQPTPVAELQHHMDLNDLEVTPIVAGGCVFVAIKSGDVFALDANSGSLVWTRHFDIGETGIGGAFVGTPSYSRGHLYFIANKFGGPFVMSLDPGTGATEWKSNPIADIPGYYSNASPVVYDHVLIAGFSGTEGDPSAHGGFTLLDTHDGSILVRTYTIPPSEWGGCQAPPPLLGPASSGCAGGGIWTTAAVDTQTGYAYMGSGNPFSKQVPNDHTNAILKVDVRRGRSTFGQEVAYYKGNVDHGTTALDPAFNVTCNVIADPGPPPSGPLPPPMNQLQQFNDSWGCGQQDLDFGAAPNLIHTPQGLRVGAFQKSGVYHLFDPATGADTQTMLATGCMLCNGSSPAYDASRGQVVASVATMTTDGFDPLTANVAWRVPRTDGVVHYQPVSIAAGVAYVLTNEGTLVGIDEATGLPVLTRQLAQDGAPESEMVFSSNGVAIANHTVYVAAGHHLLAYRAPGAAAGRASAQPPMVATEAARRLRRNRPAL